MPVAIVKAPGFLSDAELQFEWYLDKAGEDIARRYLSALDETLRRLAHQPFLGRKCRFRSDALKALRCQVVARPFDTHLVFYRVEGESLQVVRVMHGARDLPRRLRQAPETG